MEGVSLKEFSFTGQVRYIGNLCLFCESIERLCINNEMRLFKHIQNGISKLTNLTSLILISRLKPRFLTAGFMMQQTKAKVFQLTIKIFIDFFEYPALIALLNIAMKKFEYFELKLYPVKKRRPHAGALKLKNILNKILNKIKPMIVFGSKHVSIIINPKNKAYNLQKWKWNYFQIKELFQ